MSMVRVTPNLSVDPNEVESMQWDNRHYVNGSENTLVIKLKSGREHRIKHDAYCNAFIVEDNINRAKATEEKGK